MTSRLASLAALLLVASAPLALAGWASSGPRRGRGPLEGPEPRVAYPMPSLTAVGSDGAPFAASAAASDATSDRS